MIVYNGTKALFRNDIFTNDIGQIISDAYFEATGRKTGRSEFDSWQNSLQFVDRALNDPEIPDDAGVSIEYHIPGSSKRIDFILTGKAHDQTDTAVLIELKQWQESSLTDKDGIVQTRFKHGLKETPHPSYQVWSYKCLLEDYNRTVQEEVIRLVPCAYLHNYNSDEVIRNDFYSEYLKEAPVFLKNDAVLLRDFLKQNIKHGDSEKLMERIDSGKLRPSKNLADSLSNMLQGNTEFTLVDDQKVVYETALKLAQESSEKDKNVLIVQGGPGTGKSVVAINLLVELTKRGQIAQYVSKNSAPREVYRAKLSGTMTKSRIDTLFSGSGSYHSIEKDSFDTLIVDEAHRLNQKSGLFGNLGENQVKELIEASKFSIFFVDENQKVTLKDIGDVDEITFWADKVGAKVTILELESQFRCNGSDGYLAWLDNILQIRETANYDLENIDYDFKVFDSPEDMYDAIVEKNSNNKSRALAGYCWQWKSKKDANASDIEIGLFKKQWNLNSMGQSWIMHPDSVKEIGCIHTSQGLELDYVGVIIGPDLIVRDGVVKTDISERAKGDKTVSGWKKRLAQDPANATKQFDQIIKNTYRTLMTRGQKGCYVYCTDYETNLYIKNLMRMK